MTLSEPNTIAQFLGLYALPACISLLIIQYGVIRSNKKYVEKFRLDHQHVQRAVNQIQVVLVPKRKYKICNYATRKFDDAEFSTMLCYIIDMQSELRLRRQLEQQNSKTRNSTDILSTETTDGIQKTA